MKTSMLQRAHFHAVKDIHWSAEVPFLAIQRELGEETPRFVIVC